MNIEKTIYDLIVLGGGPAGYYAAEQAGGWGANTLLIEKEHLGGVCLNYGCIPSKTLLYSAKRYSEARLGQKYGVTINGKVEFSLETVMARKQKIIETLRKGIAGALKRKKVTLVSGSGKILPRDGEHLAVDVSGKVYRGRRLLICTGSLAVRLPIEGADQSFVHTNREILSIDHIPQNLTVIGGGVIGLELANFFAEVGSRVTVIELLPAIGGPIDGDIASILLRELTDKGIQFKLESRVSSIGKQSVQYESAGKKESLPADSVLMSVGRRPRTEDIGLENLNIATERGAIQTDPYGRTSAAGVWAAGDVNGRSMLAHTAYREGDVAVRHMFGHTPPLRYDAVPSVIYTHPEAAAVGMTEAEASRAGLDTAVTTLPMSYNGRYLAETENGRGLCKIIINKKDHTLLGVHMIGGHCSEMIFGCAAMIEGQFRTDDIRDVIFPHPTVSEIIKDSVSHLPI